MIALLATVAWAGTEPAPKSSIAVGLRGATEAWSDPAIGQIYRSGTWMAGLGVVTRLGGWLAIDTEAMFRRLQSETTKLELVPLSVVVEVRRPMGAVEPFAGLGPTWTGFSEGGATGSTTPTPLVSGARLGLEARAGLRVDTGLVHAPMAPAQGGPVKAVELELMVGRRSELPGGDGFSLGAWRGGVGVLARF